MSLTRAISFGLLLFFYNCQGIAPDQRAQISKLFDEITYCFFNQTDPINRIEGVDERQWSSCLKWITGRPWNATRLLSILRTYQRNKCNQMWKVRLAILSSIKRLLAPEDQTCFSMKSFSLLSGLVLEVNQAQKEAFDLKGRARLFFSPVLAYACIFFFQDWIHYCLLNIALILEGKEPRIRLMVSQSTEGGPDGVPIFHPQSPLPHPDYSLAQIGSSSPGSDMERKKKPSIAARCARPHCCPGQAISPPEPAKDYSALVPRCLEIKNFEPFQGLVGHCLILTALVLAQWRYRIELDAYPNQDDLMLELNSLAMNLDAFFNNTDNCIFLSPETCIQASHVADQALAFCSSMEARSGGIMTPPFSQWMIGQLLSSSPTKPLEF